MKAFAAQGTYSAKINIKSPVKINGPTNFEEIFKNRVVNRMGINGKKKVNISSPVKEVVSSTKKRNTSGPDYVIKEKLRFFLAVLKPFHDKAPV